MEVHHHAHTARKKWTHYLWEFLMLFLAVFCGFMAENQREHYIEKIRAKDYARALVHDLENDTTQLSGILDQVKNLVRMYDSFLNVMKNRLAIFHMRFGFAFIICREEWINTTPSL